MVLEFTSAEGNTIVLTSRTRLRDDHIPKPEFIWSEWNMENLTSFRDLLTNPELRMCAQADIYVRCADVWASVRSYWKDKGETEEQLAEREEKTIHMLIWNNYGSRVWAELMQRATEPTSEDQENEFGRLVREAREDPTFYAHAWPHVRNFKAYLTEMIVILGADIYDETGILPVATGMVPDSHDFTQLLLEQMQHLHAANGNAWSKLDFKDDHKEAAAVFAELVRPLAAHIGHMSDGLSRVVFSVLESEIAVHDRLEDFHKRLDVSNSDRAENLHPDKVYAANMNSTLYQHNLAPAERFSILKHRQKDAAKDRGFAEDIDEIYGKLGFPNHVVRHFPKGFARVQNDQTRPKPQDFGVNLKLLSSYESLLIGPDVFEMMLPGKESLDRKLQVGRQKAIVLLKIGEDIEEVKRKDPHVKDWNLSTRCRVFYEAKKIVQIAKHSAFGQNKLFMQRIENTVLYNVVQIEEALEQYARGDIGIVYELDGRYQDRVRNLTMKILVNAGLNDASIVQFGSDTGGFKAEKIKVYLEKALPGENEYKANFYNRIGQISEQLRIVRNNLIGKPAPEGEKKQEGYAYAYPEKIIENMKTEFMDYFIYLCGLLGHSEEQARKLYIQWSDKIHIDTTQMIKGGGYDPSKPDLTHARRINPSGYKVTVDS